MTQKHAIFAIGVFLVASFLGLRIYFAEMEKWFVSGDGPIMEIKGDAKVFHVLLRNEANYDQVIKKSLFRGFRPEMIEGEYPENRIPDGQILEDEVDYLVFAVAEGRLLQHSYIQTGEVGAYGAQLLEFRPSAMHLEDLFTFDILELAPKVKDCKWGKIIKEKEKSRFLVQIEDEGDIVKRFIWEISW